MPTPTRPRRGVLAVVFSSLARLTLLALVAGCGPSESPFRMWDMRPGMSLAELDSMSVHDQSAAYSCAASVLGYRTCSVPLRGSPGRMDALVDSTGRVVELSFTTGVRTLASNAPSDGASYRMLMRLAQESRGLVSEWHRVADSDTVYSPEVGWIETWLAGKGRWRARIVWQGTWQPSLIRITEVEKADAHTLALNLAELERDPLAERASEPERAVRSELRRLVHAQQIFRRRNGTYADGLAALHFVPRDGIVVEIGGARPAGWWARGGAEDGSVDGIACEVWDGVPPPRPVDFAGPAGEPVCP